MIDLNIVFNEFVKYKKYIFGITLALLVLTEAVCFFVSPVYRTEATLFLPWMKAESASECGEVIEQQHFPGLCRVNYSHGKRMITLTFEAKTAEDVHELAINNTELIVNNINNIVQNDSVNKHELDQLNAIKKELDSIKKNNIKDKKLLDKIKILEKRINDSDKKLRLNRVRVLLPESLPDKPVYPQPVKYGGFAITLGLLISFTFILVRTITRRAAG